MKVKTYLMAAMTLITASMSSVNAQLIVRDHGAVQIGHSPSWLTSALLRSDYDTIPALNVIGPNEDGTNSCIAFGDQTWHPCQNVIVGEYPYHKNPDSDILWLQGRHGMYATTRMGADQVLFYYDVTRDTCFHFNCNVLVKGEQLLASDRRFKENINPIEGVLPSLGKLSAVTFNYKGSQPGSAKTSARASSTAGQESEKARQERAFFDSLQSNRKDTLHYGFIAQEVKEVFPELVKTDGDGYMYVNYIGLIPILVESVKELGAKVEEQAALIEELKGESPQASPQKAPRQASEMMSDRVAARLYQNTPNPFTVSTSIRFTLPETVSNAAVYIYDLQGKQLKSIPVMDRGTSQVTINGSELQAGMYVYALVADGQLVDTKQMILTK